MELEITQQVKQMLLSKYAPHIYKVKSSDGTKEYLITLARNHFSCSCPDCTFRNLNPDGTKKKIAHYCKHQVELAQELLNHSTIVYDGDTGLTSEGV